MAYDDLKTEAETVRRRLAYGPWRLGEARSWADRIIQGTDKPHEWLIDVSTATTTTDALEALSRAEGEPDTSRMWAAHMQDLLRMLDAEPERDSEIAKVLFDLRMSGEAPAREASSAMYSFWDAIDLAKQGTFGVLEEERAKLRDFLRRWSVDRGGIASLEA